MSNNVDLDPWNAENGQGPSNTQQRPTQPSQPTFSQNPPTRRNIRVLQSRIYDGVDLTEEEYYDVMEYNSTAEVMQLATAKGEDWVDPVVRKAMKRQLEKDLRAVRKRLRAKPENTPTYRNSPLRERLQSIQIEDEPEEEEEQPFNEDPLNAIDFAPDGGNESDNNTKRKTRKSNRQNNSTKTTRYSPEQYESESEEEESQRRRRNRKPKNREESAERERRSAKRKLAKTLFEGIPKYNGTYGDERQFRVFVAAAEEWADVQEDLNEKDALKSITSLFRGEASEWWMNHKEQYSPRDSERISTFDDLKSGLKERFLPAINYSKSKAEYRNCKQT